MKFNLLVSLPNSNIASHKPCPSKGIVKYHTVRTEVVILLLCLCQPRDRISKHFPARHLLSISDPRQIIEGCGFRAHLFLSTVSVKDVASFLVMGRRHSKDVRFFLPFSVSAYKPASPGRQIANCRACHPGSEDIARHACRCARGGLPFGSTGATPESMRDLISDRTSLSGLQD
eukprot:149549-Amorphochlora_amoeboformis.AAC.3